VCGVFLFLVWWFLLFLLFVWCFVGLGVLGGFFDLWFVGLGGLFCGMWGTFFVSFSVGYE